MKIVIDEKIPYLRDALLQMGHSVLAMSGDAITSSHLVDAEALFVRTRTLCNASLLDGTAVRFIGTATIGYDHIDAGYCKQKGIVWTNAPGCNADAVLQYVQSTVYSWARCKGLELSGLNIGIVGVGQIGSRIEQWARSVGMRPVLNDPPRAAKGEQGFSTLDEVAAQCDIITFHPTLSRGGAYPSFHLADSSFFTSLQRCRLIINASRGAVVDNEALSKALDSGCVESAAVDVWEGEPHLNSKLLQQAYIATPHIAGYSAEGKINATRMVLETFARFINYNSPLPVLTLAAPDRARVQAATLSEALLAIYDPLTDTEALKNAPHMFESLRNNYKLRREPTAYNIVIKW